MCDAPQRQQSHGADGVSFTGRRGPLEFEGVGASFGEEEAAREEEKDVEDEEEDDKEDEEDDGDEADEQEDAAEDADDLVEVGADGVIKKKASGSRGPL
jgi:hypothetical protein